MSATEIAHEPSVDVIDLRIALTGSGVDVVDEISVEVRPGEVLGLVGESGSGKTTVGMALLGHVRRGGEVAGGVIRIDGRDLSSLGERELRRLRGGVVSYIPQDPGTSLNPALRISTQLEEILEAHATEGGAEQHKARVREALEEVALPSDDEFLKNYPHQLSGGQQQRVAIAMAFANRPHVIVCDEPTTGLDVTTQARVLETVRDLCQSHRVAALYVSHDLAVVAELADHVAVMYGGRIVESGTRDQLFTDPRHPYTRRLLRAVPDIAGKRTVVGIPGHAALPGSRPQGCYFHPRCQFARDDCRAEFPPVTDLGEGHRVRCYHVADASQQPPPEGAGQIDKAQVGEDVVLAIRNLNAQLRRHPDPVRHRHRHPPQRVRGAGRRVRQRQDDHGTLRGRAAQAVDRRGQPARHGARAVGAQSLERGTPGDPVRLPEPVRVAEPAHHDRADDRA